MPRLLDVIQYDDPSGNEIVHKIPDSGPGDIRLGAQLVVHESQAAVFYRDGRGLDVFGPGRHTLATGNLPFLDTIVKFISNGNTPFQAEVCFVNQKVFMDQKWGTHEPIDVEDARFGMVSLRAFGTYTFRIGDPQLFVNTIVGTQGVFTTDSLTSYMKSSIVTHFSALVGSMPVDYLHIRAATENINAAMKAKVKDDFAKYGIEMRDFMLQSISLPEDVQEAIHQREKMGILGTDYAQMRTLDVMEQAAKNPGGGAGAAFGMGAGFGMGQMMPGMMQNAMGAPQATSTGAAPASTAPPAAAVPAAEVRTCPSCNATGPVTAKFCLECGKPMNVKPHCTNCGEEIPVAAKFCANCGTKQAYSEAH